MEVMVNFLLQKFYPRGNNLKYPLKRMLGGRQMQSGHFVEDKNPLALP
jgi:hypothetical protein